MCKMETKQTPLLRFRAYKEVWKQYKLGEISNRITRKNTNLESTLPLTISAQYGLIDQNDFFNKQIASRDISGYYLVQNGEFAYNKSYSKGYPWGAVKRLDKYAKGVLSTLYIVFEPKNVSSSYLAAYYDSFKWHREVSARAAEGARNHGLLNIAPQDFFETQLFVPAKEEEQEKIGRFFEQIDIIIGLYQRELELLRLEKRMLLSKMFPKGGELVPQIRFKEFSNDWEQRRLLDNIKSITDFRGRTPKKLGMDWSSEGFLALSALNVKDGYIDFTQDVHYGNQELYDKWMSGKELHKGQVLFTTEAPMGNVAQVPDNRQYILSQRTIAFEVYEELIAENYLAITLRTPDVFSKFTALSSGGTAKGVSQRTLATVEIIVPSSLEEQELLSSYFCNIDHLITLHQRKLELMKEMKKTLLKYMFI